MGSSLFGGGTSKVNSTTNSNQNFSSGGTQSGTSTGSGSSGPPAFQLPYLTEGLKSAAGLLQGGANYSPLAYTGLSPSTVGALGNLSGFANSMAPYGGQLAGSGAGGVNTGLNGAGTALGGVLQSGTTDPTQGNISAAGQYANNPYTQGLIKAAQTPIERQLTEVALPGLNTAASATGNTDSSRSAMTEAILRRSAGEDEANVASNILGSQYNNGLNLAESSRVANNNALLGAASAGTGLAGVSGNLVSSGNSLGLQDYGVPVSTGQLQQQDANTGNQVAYNNFLTGQQFPYQQLANYWNIVGRPLGTDTTQTQNQTQASNTSGNSTGLNLTNGTQTQPGPGILGGTLGLASGIGSFFAPTGAFGTGPSTFKSLFG